MLGYMTPVSKQPVPVLEEITLERVTESRISTVISMLPMSLTSRISPFGSPKRSTSLHDLRGDDTRDSSPTKGAGQSLSDNDTVVMASNRLASKALAQTSCSPAKKLDFEAPPLPNRTRGRASASVDVSRTTSGINCRYARLGSDLVRESLRADAAFQASDNGDFERKAYMDGLQYLLRGLPRELDEYEVAQLRSSLPPEVGMLSPSPERGGHQMSSQHGRSALHRMVQAFVVYFMLLFHSLVPYLLVSVRYGLRMERKYRVSEKLVGSSIDLATKAGKQGVVLTDTICRLNEGKVGRAVQSLVAWTVDGISRGISDGVHEGFVTLGVNHAS